MQALVKQPGYVCKSCVATGGIKEQSCNTLAQNQPHNNAWLITMQTCMLPDSSQSQQLQELDDTNALAATSDYLWNELLKHLKKSNSNTRKGKRWAPSIWLGCVARTFFVNGLCLDYHCLHSSHSLIVTKGDIMKVRNATRKQFWRMSKSFAHLHVLKLGGSKIVNTNQTPTVPQAAGGVLFWLCLHHLMAPSQTCAKKQPRVTMKDDEIFSRPNTQGISTPVLQPSTTQELYLLKVYRALCFTCHLHESLPSALYLSHTALSHARKNMKRNVPPGNYIYVHCTWRWPRMSHAWTWFQIMMCITCIIKWMHQSCDLVSQINLNT